MRRLSGLLVLVGAGKMGGALLDGWLRAGLDPANTVVIEPEPSPQIAALARRGMRINPDPASLTRNRGAHHRREATDRRPSIAGDCADDRRLHSGRIDHGRADAAIPRRRLSNAGALVRAMPNTPAAIGRGITVAVPLHANQAQRELAHVLLSATGTVEWLEDEGAMDAVTAVSGSGPAYVFLFAEALAQAGIAAGLPRALAEKLARETVAGAGEMLHRSALDAATLRENVTSPGGTTAAALEVLMGENGLAPLLKKAVAAATERSRKLAG